MKNRLKILNKINIALFDKTHCLHSSSFNYQGKQFFINTKYQFYGW